MQLIIEDNFYRRLVLTAADCSRIPWKLQIFRNVKIPGLTEKESEQLGFADSDSWLYRIFHLFVLCHCFLFLVSLFEAVMCSCAAPKSFVPYKGKYIDGGIIDNDPTMDLLKVFKTYNTGLKINVWLQKSTPLEI